jgi:hypothetical protein
MAPMTCGVCNRIKGKFVQICLHVGPQSLQPLGLAGHLKARVIFRGLFPAKKWRIASYFTERRKGSGVEVEDGYE